MRRGSSSTNHELKSWEFQITPWYMNITQMFIFSKLQRSTKCILCKCLGIDPKLVFWYWSGATQPLVTQEIILLDKRIVMVFLHSGDLLLTLNWSCTMLTSGLVIHRYKSWDPVCYMEETVRCPLGDRFTSRIVYHRYSSYGSLPACRLCSSVNREKVDEGLFLCEMPHWNILHNRQQMKWKPIMSV